MRNFFILLALLLSLTGCKDTQMRYTVKAKCRTGSNFIVLYEIKYFEDGRKSVLQNIGLSHGDRSYSYFRSLVKFANDFETIENIKINGNSVQIKIDNEVYGDDIKFVNLPDECLNDLKTFIQRDDELVRKTAIIL